jgi:hypothetical protein
MTGKITRLPSQATHGNNYGRRVRGETPEDRRFRLQQETEAWEEAFLIDGWQDSQRY